MKKVKNTGSAQLPEHALSADTFVGHTYIVDAKQIVFNSWNITEF